MEKIYVRLVLEILGRPKEEVLKALSALVTRLGTEQGVSIKQQTLHEAVPVKDSKDLFTTFAEVELELDTISHFFMVVFGYMPAHIEIISPQNLEVANTAFTESANRIVHKLHDYDAIAKKMLYERNILLRKIQEQAPALFKEITTPPAQRPAPVKPVKQTLAKKKKVVKKKKK